MPPDHAVPASTLATAAASTAPIGVEQAEAALVEHYPRLARIAYLVLPPSLGRNRRVLTAHAIVQRSLPRGRAVPPPATPAATPLDHQPPDAAYLFLRERVLRRALASGRAGHRLARRLRVAPSPPLPRVLGLRLFPRSGGADELALERRLSALSGPARAVLVLRVLEGLSDAEVRHALAAADAAADVAAALAEADCAGLTAPGTADAPDTADAARDAPGSGAPRADMAVLLRSSEFDPCSLQAGPTDLMSRRRRARATVAAAAALLLCGAFLVRPDDGWGPDGAAAPAYAPIAAARSALDPAEVRRVAPTAWRTAVRTDFSVWPARGRLADDRALLRRALAVWAGTGASVHVSTTPATPSGPPMGPPQLLYAGTVDAARVVLLYDGLRIVRYAEAADGRELAALDFARVDGAGEADSAALIVARSDGNVRYLTAPWVSATSVRDLLDPRAPARALRRDADGVTDPLASPAMARDCRTWDTLEVRGGSREERAGRTEKTEKTEKAKKREKAGKESTAGKAESAESIARLFTDLGELTPARLTSGPPSAPQDLLGEKEADADRAAWARTACLLPAVRMHGVRSVNSWRYATQPLPEANGTADWLCTRAETWRGPGGRVLAQFQAPARRPAAPGAAAARSEPSPACGPRDERVVAGVLWKSRGGRWYVLAAGGPGTAALEVSGGVTGSARGRLLAVPAKEGAHAELYGRAADGTRLDPPR
ncbi:hypothetical protein GCM10009654_30250 [Streptomyces hebeiensis]|uniref:DNA-directed RNA polymerase specialized sigma24 family protein n=1 Tax=Streptomyces hebeiensis TaxID=229486 RepID=A0ABN1UVF9_9ACTN